MKLSATNLAAYSLELRSLYKSNLYISYQDLWDVIQRHSNGQRLTRWGRYRIIANHLLTDTASLRRAVRYSSIIISLSAERGRVAHNQQVIQHAQDSGMTIENKALDRQQIEAVVANEDAQLVIAAAGSGKTLSLLGKCQYLVQRLGVPENKILAISFTKSSADELADRLSSLNINVEGKTFHALGKAILDNGNIKVLDETTQKNRLRKIINQLIVDSPSFGRQFNDYLLFYFSSPIDLSELATLDEIIHYNKSFLGKTLQNISLNKQDYASKDATPYLRTVRGETVRSKEEQIIADYLFINSIPYAYEQPYPGSNGRYHPDFTITQFDTPIYLEHQGIDRQGRTRSDIDPVRYMEKVEWSRRHHQDHDTTLIQSYSYEFTEGTVLRNLERNLKGYGVSVTRRREDEISQLLNDGYKKETSRFNDLIATFITLYKTNDRNFTSLRSRAVSMNRYQNKRTTKFLDIIETIYIEYQRQLADNQEIDFADMITLAADHIPALPSNAMTYDYILVDEVQDLSDARYRLLKALLDRNPRAKLFCVGDDWQSIFRFAGSDLSLLHQFDKRFDRHAYHSVIEQTHRFSNPLLSYTSDFIQKNPQQQPKNIYAADTNATPLRFTPSATRSDLSALDDQLKKLVDDYGSAATNQSIMLLSRYSYDVDRLEPLIDKLTWLHGEDTDSPFLLTDKQSGVLLWRDLRSNTVLEIQHMTMHRSKGKTCDHTFILNCNGGANGMPAMRTNDPVISLLLSRPDTFPDAEERRLLYVAMTRAKRSTTILYDKANPSSFLADLHMQPEQSTKTCPRCSMNTLVLRDGKYGQFAACSNYWYGCTYKSQSADVVRLAAAVLLQ